MIKKQQEFDSHISHMGRHFHVMRNYIQGFVENDYPEFCSIDNIAGRMEGVVRTMKSNLQGSRDIKKDNQILCKNALFLQKILAQTNLGDSFEKSKLDKISASLEEIIAFSKSIDIHINNAILEISEQSTGCKLPRVPTIDLDPQMTPRLLNLFDIRKGLKEIETNKARSKGAETCILSEYMSNQAHYM